MSASRGKVSVDDFPFLPSSLTMEGEERQGEKQNAKGEKVK
jgi:hypothetical protein